MTARQLRRAAERKARKLERKQELAAAGIIAAPERLAPQSPAAPAVPLDWEPAVALTEPSTGRLTANRANAQHSTGPISDEGKAISSLNAVKTGLTGRTVLLHSDDAALYGKHIAAYRAEYQPVGLRECELVQSLADTQWRLQRIPGLEMAIYAQGRAENQAYVDEHQAAGPNLIELGTYLKYEKQLRNLQLQEARLTRRYEKEMTELRVLQTKRKQQEAEAARAVNNLDSNPGAQRPMAASAPGGFVFSDRTSDGNVHAENFTSRPKPEAAAPTFPADPIRA